MPKRVNQTLSEGLDGDKWQEFLANVRGHLRNDGDWKSLADEANMVVSTIRNIAYGKTRSPHAFTIYRLMAALGRVAEFEQAVASDTPMSLDEAKRLNRNYQQRLKRKQNKAASRKVGKVAKEAVPVNGSAKVIKLEDRKRA